MATAIKPTVLEALKKAGALQASFRLYELLKTANPPTLYRNLQYLATRHPEDLPLPPLRSIVLVTGNADIPSFLEGGKLAAESIVNTLARNELELSRFDAILDFGCGCGRVIRHWHSLRTPILFGSDYNPKLIEWCSHHLTFAQFATNQLAPPLTYENGKFDLIYALSVFTHLPESLQHQWMTELLRVLRPGGYLIISTHGRRYLDLLTESEAHAFEAGQLVTRYQEVAGTNMCSAFHPSEYVRRTLARSLEVVDFIPEGATGNPRQDVHLLRKPIS